MAILTVIALLGGGCFGKQEDMRTSVVIADQFGLAYAPIEIMKAKGFLEEELSLAGLDYEIEWKKLPNTAMMREAMLSNELDFGFVGIPPFLIGKDKGMDWRIISGLSESPLGLVGSSSLRSLDDLAPQDKIILPQPGSIQHILLSMYAERVYGDAGKFDDRLVSLSHPDGVTVVQSGETNVLHFTAPPYLEAELDQSHRVILDGETCFGGAFTFIVGICPERVYREEALYRAFSAALSRSIEFMNQSETAAMEILRQVYTEQELKSLSELNYTGDVKGLDRFSKFMYEQKIISKLFEVEDVVWKD